ncbi:MAG: hypothetical protein JXB34_02550 [Bacteroidales bacterium]|nr:hypothetical protein [Bacteroidales bacterium]
MKPKILVISLFLFTGMYGYGQVSGIGDFFGSGPQNAEILFKSYFAPWTNALGASLNGGWYNTAKSHKPLGFDITFTTSVAIVPEVDKTFNLGMIGLQGVTPVNVLTPTVAGSRDGGQLIRYTPVSSFPDQYAEFTTPQGTGVSIMPTPMLKIGIGTFKDTDIDFRYVPDVSLGKFGEMGLWGIGIKHGIKQWIPVVSKVPVFQLAVQGGYTQFSTAFDISVTPESYGLSGTGDYTNQQVSLLVNSFTANILVGASLPVIDFYGGAGFATTNANLKLAGYYPIPVVQAGEITTVQSHLDPIDVEITNSDGSKTKPRLNAGIRIKMGVLTLHGDYTYANYSVVTTGIGISFR